jgi:hypothetical protein
MLRSGWQSLKLSPLPALRPSLLALLLRNLACALLLWSYRHTGCPMTSTRFLGGLALALGGGLPLSGPWRGQDLLVELTGTQMVPLRLMCTITVTVGACALGVGIREEREHSDKKGDMEK